MENKEGFSYTYSAKEQAELEKIRKKYMPEPEDKMEQLRQLDRQPGRKAKLWAVVLGSVGALVMGTGMSLAMTDFGAGLGKSAMAVGVAVGLAGMVLVALAYPLYNRILRRERTRIAPEILRLTDELMK